MNKLKKEALLSKIALIVCCLLLAVFFFWGTNYRYTLGQPVDLEDVPVEELEGAYVAVDLDYIYGCYAYTEKTNTETKKTTITQREYLIDCGEDYCIGLLLKDEEMAKAEELLDQSEDFIEGKRSSIDAGFLVTGIVQAMPSDSLEFMHEVVGYDTLTSAEKEIFLPLYIKPAQTDADILMLVFSLFFLCGALYYLIPILSGRNQRAVREKLLKLYGDNTAGMDQMLNYLFSLPNTKGLRIGQGYLLCRVDAKHYLLDSNDLIWAYQQTTTKKAYGFIPLGASYALCLKTIDGKEHILPMREKEVKQSLQLLTQTFPGTAIGYSAEISSLYYKNPELLRQVAAMQRQA